MTRRLGSTRRAGSPLAQLPRSRPGRVALLAVALALVLMHHVVGAHQHSGADVAVEHAATHGAGPGTSAAGAALLHLHPDGNGHDHAASPLHLCLAAPVGVAALLLVLVLVALWWRTPPSPVAMGGVAPARAARAPPASSRQVELQVLRL